MARPGPGVKRAKMLPADQHRAPSARPEGRADSVGRGRRDNAGLPERHIFSEREVVATENNKAVLHYPGGEFEMDIVKATEGNDGIAIGKLLAETGLTTFDPGYTATGSTTSAITYIAGGDVPLSVGMTIVSTLISPLMTPLMVYLLAGAWVEVSFLAMVISVVKVILIPVLLGILLRSLFGRQIQKISEVLPLISVVAIVMIISGIVANNSEKIITSGILVLCIVVLHNLCGMSLGMLAAKIFRIPYNTATAISIEVGMQNSGLAVSLATANFATNPLATLPGAIFSVWHNISGSIFAGIRRKGQPKREETAE